MSDNRSSSGGVGFGLALFLLFLGLKLGHVITWSWWWVTSPLWLPVAVGLLVGFFSVVPAVVRDWREERRYEQEREERQRLTRSADRAIYDEWGKPREH